MKFQPLRDNVAIKILKHEETTESGLYVPTDINEPSLGLVEAVGEDVKDIKAGDTVIYTKGSGISYKHMNDDYLILSVKYISGKKIGE